MRISDVIKVIEDFAPLSVQEDWDNCGLQVGDPDAQVKGILVGFDCTPELVDEAVETGANLIVTHHPLIFRGVKKIMPTDPVGLAIMKAIAGGVAVYSAHTSADKVPGGVNTAFAGKLGLQDPKVLEADADGNGFGMVGNLKEPMTAREFVEFVKKTFSLKCVRCSKPITGKISRVAVCGGSGSFLIGAAQASGAQAYLCGDVSYHYFITMDGFMILDIGHFEGEVEIVNILFSLLKKNFPTFAVRMCRSLGSRNPVYYL